MTNAQMADLQSAPYRYKLAIAEGKAREFYEEMVFTRGMNVHVSVGGLDSITLWVYLQHLGLDVPGISVSLLEDRSIQLVHKAMGIKRIQPHKSKVAVLKEYGFPVISKGKASKIEYLQTPDSPKQTFIHAIMTGDMGEQGGFEYSNKIKLPDKWLKLFAGHYQKHRPGLPCNVAPFKVSAKCCKWMKEDPCEEWAKTNLSAPYLGLMASEGGQRALGLTKNGCNYYGKTTIRSCPFATWMRQDLLRLAMDMDNWCRETGRLQQWGLDTIIPAIYGEILQRPNGDLYTTEAQRTGCTMCGFGIHIEKRPHRFDRLRASDPRQWAFWMYQCMTDPGTGKKYGWGRVLDYIGVAWEDDPHGNVSGQLDFWGNEAI